MNFTPSEEATESAIKSLQVYLGYVRSQKTKEEIIVDYTLQRQGRKISEESEKIISKCLLELEILTKKDNCKCSIDETTGFTDFQDSKGNVCNICGGASK